MIISKKCKGILFFYIDLVIWLFGDFVILLFGDLIISCRSQLIRYMFLAFCSGVSPLIAECGLCSL